MDFLLPRWEDSHVWLNWNPFLPSHPPWFWFVPFCKTSTRSQLNILGAIVCTRSTRAVLFLCFALAVWLAYFLSWSYIFLMLSLMLLLLHNSWLLRWHIWFTPRMVLFVALYMTCNFWFSETNSGMTHNYIASLEGYWYFLTKWVLVSGTRWGWELTKSTEWFPKGNRVWSLPLLQF